MSNENELLKKQVLDYFTSNKIEVPEEIQKHIDSVFNEFEFDQEDSVNIYFQEDLELFESDLTVNNINNVHIDGVSNGVYTGTYTYTENIEYIINEKTELYSGNEAIETLVDIASDERSTIESPADWAVVVLETITYGDGEFTRIPRLYIYSPNEGAGIE